MKIVTFSYENRTQLGEIIDDRVYVLSGSDTMRMRDLLWRGITPNRVSKHYPLADVTLHAPLQPGKIIAIGRNYAAHAQETGSDIPEAPLIFSVFPSAVIGPGEAITWSEAITKEVDWEGELAVVIGKKTRNVSEEDALKQVFGYTIANDVTARDLQKRIDKQWTRGKSLDTFCPLGPYLVTAPDVPDPQALHIETRVNDEVMQDGSTGDMIFSVAYLIAYASRMFTLEPGDIILTGTPPGVGEGMDPKRFLQDGDTVSITIDGLGTLSNPVAVTA